MESLQTLVANAGKDIDLFRTSVENWYDDHMDRVSGWYKRHVAKITIVIGAILVLLLNINTLTIGRTLYSNSVVRTAVSSVAAKTTSCPAEREHAEVPGGSAGAAVGRHAGRPADRMGNGRRLRSAEDSLQLAGPARASSAATAARPGRSCWSSSAS